MKRQLLFIILCVVLPLPVHAISPSDRDAIYSDTVYYDPTAPQSCDAAGPVNSTLPDAVPEPYRSIFTRAAAKFNTDPFLLTAIFYGGEHAASWPDPPPPYGNGEPWASSSAGAQGPFQFLAGTWVGSSGPVNALGIRNGYGQDGDGDGDADIQDLTDAAFGAANYLSANGGTNGAPVGDPAGPLPPGQPNLVNAIWNYNHARFYVEQVLEAYNGFKTGRIAAAATPIAGGGPCGGLSISADGFVFPLRTTKAVLRTGTDGAIWNMLSGNCTRSSYGCHGRWGGATDSADDDNRYYYATDIHAPPGTPVVAARGGVVVNGGINGDGAYAITIRGEDGNYYYYTHMAAASSTLRDNDTVLGGQTIGAVGTREDTGNGSAAHLHFDIARRQVGKRFRGCAFRNCPDMQYLIDSYELLTQQFDGLPEE